MAIPHVQSGEVITLKYAPDAAEIAGTKTLVKTDALEVIRMTLPKGKEIQEHKAPGDITIQCLDGNVDFSVGTEVRSLSNGTMLYLDAQTPHSVRAVEDSVLLLTLALVHRPS